ncbi:MAG: hypothetical protein ACOCXQ_02240 [Patescibacteria group bacterium]
MDPSQENAGTGAIEEQQKRQEDAQKEQAALEKLKDQIVKDLTGSDKRKARLRMEKLESDAGDLIDNIQDNPAEEQRELNTPDPDAATSESDRSKVLSLKEAMKIIPHLIKDKQDEFFNTILLKKAEGVNKYILLELIGRINLDSLNIEVIPYVFSLFSKAIKNKIKNPLKDAITETRLVRIANLSPTLYGTVVSVLTDAAVKEKNMEEKVVQEWRQRVDTRANQQSSTPPVQNPADQGAPDPLDDLFNMEEFEDFGPASLVSGASRRELQSQKTLSGQELAEVDNALRDIQKKVTEYLDPSGAQPYDFDDFQKVLDYYYFGPSKFEELNGPESLQRVKQIFSSPGINLPRPSDIQPMLDQRGFFLGLLQNAQYNGMVESAQDVVDLLNPSLIYTKLVNADGTWNDVGSDELRRDIIKAVNSLFRGATSDPFSEFKQNFNPQMEGMILRQIQATILRFGNDPIFSMVTRKKLEAAGAPPEVVKREENIARNRFKSYFTEVTGRINLIQFLTQQAHDTSLVSEVTSKQRAELFDQFKESDIRNLLDKERLLQETESLVGLNDAWNSAENFNVIPERYGTSAEIVVDGTNIKKKENPDRRNFTDRVRKIVNMVQAYGKGKINSGTMFPAGCDDNMRRAILEGFFLDREFSDWEFDSVTPIAEWVSRIITDETSMYLALTDVRGSPRLPQDDRELPSTFGSFKASAEITRHRAGNAWGFGRGLTEAGTGDIFVEYPLPTTHAITVETDMQQLEEKRRPEWWWRKERNIAQEREEYINRNIYGIPDSEETMARRLKEGFFDSNRSMLDLYEGILFSKNWKYEGGYGINPNLIKYFEYETGLDWDTADRADRMKWVTEQSGFGSQYYFLKDFVSEDLKGYAGRLLGLDPSIHSKQLGELMGQRSGKAFLDVKIGAMDKMVTETEFTNRLTESRRADMIYEGLKKQPIVFLTHLIQTIPELADGEIEVTFSDPNQAKETVKASDFYFSERFRPGPNGQKMVSDKQEEQRRKVYNNARIYFGEQNIPHIRHLMDFFHGAYQEFGEFSNGTEPSQSPTTPMLMDRKKEAFDNLFVYVNGASVIARLEGTDIKPEYIITDEEYAQRGNPSISQEEREDIEKRMKTRNLLFGSDNSLITHFTNYVDHQGEEQVFGDKDVSKLPEGQTMHIGDNTSFFHRYSKSWYDLKNIQYDPMFYRSTYGVITPYPQNNDSPKRREEDKGATMEILGTKIEEFENAIASFVTNVGADDEGAVSEVFKVQEQIYQDLRKVDAPNARAINKNLTLQFFKAAEGVATGKPFPFDFLRMFMLGKKGSWLKGDYNKANLRTLSTEQQKNYLVRMVDSKMITKDQAKDIEKIMQIETKRYWITDLLPGVVITIMAFAMYQYIKQALEENEQKG